MASNGVKDSTKKIGFLIISFASLVYCTFRVAILINNFSVISFIAALVEITTLLLVSSEYFLSTTKTRATTIAPLTSVLAQSARKISTSPISEHISSTRGLYKGSTAVQLGQQTIISDYLGQPIDICVLVGEASIEELRRCFLSISIIQNKGLVYVVEKEFREEFIELIEEFDFNFATSLNQ